jgi:hypothetical protein
MQTRRAALDAALQLKVTAHAADRARLATLADRLCTLAVQLQQHLAGESQGEKG